MTEMEHIILITDLCQILNNLSLCTTVGKALSQFSNCLENRVEGNIDIDTSEGGKRLEGKEHEEMLGSRKTRTLRH